MWARPPEVVIDPHGEDEVPVLSHQRPVIFGKGIEAVADNRAPAKLCGIEHPDEEEVVDRTLSSLLTRHRL